MGFGQQAWSIRALSLMIEQNMFKIACYIVNNLKSIFINNWTFFLYLVDGISDRINIHVFVLYTVPSCISNLRIKKKKWTQDIHVGRNLFKFSSYTPCFIGIWSRSNLVLTISFLQHIMHGDLNRKKSSNVIYNFFLLTSRTLLMSV